jgi:hypothetical protein
MRCPYPECGTVFRYNPEANGPATDFPARMTLHEDRARHDLMVDLLNEHEEEKAASSSQGPKASKNPDADGKRSAARSQAPVLPRGGRSTSRKTRQRLPVIPGAQGSEASKEVLIGGKGVRFNEPRVYIGALIAFLVLAGGYGGLLVFSAFWRHYSNVSQRRADDIEKKVKDAEIDKKKKFEAVVAKSSPPEGAAGRVKVDAPTQAAPAILPSGDLTVALESAQVGAFRDGSQQEFLRVVLRITNESKIPAQQPDWSGPDVKARLRDQSFNLYKAVEGPSIRTTVTSDSPAFDTIFFERPVRGADLRLILTVPGKAKDVEIMIKAADIK